MYLNNCVYLHRPMQCLKTNMFCVSSPDTAQKQQTSICFTFTAKPATSFNLKLIQNKKSIIPKGINLRPKRLKGPCVSPLRDVFNVHRQLAC